MDAPVTPSVTPSPVVDERALVGDVVLRTTDLTKRYGKRLAVNGLNLDVRRGDVFGLLGPNGSGKSTTLRMVLGLVWPTAGSISLFGGDHSESDQRRAALRRVGAVVEQPAFYPYLTGRQNLRGVAIFAGLATSPETYKRVDNALGYVGLTERGDDAYRKYSLGMKQRLGIAAALLTQPELVVLDEPTNGLDPAGMVEVRALIQQLSQRGITVLLASHLLHEVQQVCTRVAIMKEGNLLAQGEVSNLLSAQIGLQLGFNDPAMLQSALATLQAAKASTPWLRGASLTRPDPGGWAPPGGQMLFVDAPLDEAPAINALLANAGIYAAELRRREGSLEQYFLALTGDGAPNANGARPAAAPASVPTPPQGGVA
jgi:ABC-2 type transport system ATP-binding protein